MTSVATFATPSPGSPSGIHTPPAPKHGWSDKWEPYTTRKSARIASQSKAHRTPSPKLAHKALPRKSDQTHPGSVTPASHRRTASGLSTPATSPRKRTTRTNDHPQHQMSGSSNSNKKADGRAAIHLATGMLPTPTKTPAKRNPGSSQISVDHFARDILDETPSRKKRRTIALTDDSDAIFSDSAAISFEIHTDSRDRIPQPDDTPDEIFTTSKTGGRTAASAARAQAKKVLIPGQGYVSMEEARQRPDGTVKTFRGKPIFEFRSANADAEDESPSNTPLASPARRATRRQPNRVLFQEQLVVDENDPEEAETEIEDEGEPEEHAHGLRTPTDPSRHLATPKAPRFGPMSPPTTDRITRHRHPAVETAAKGKARVPSPMEEWRVTKNTGESNSKA